MNRYVSEMIGTMVLVLMGCGSAVFAGSVTGTVGAGGFSDQPYFSYWYLRGHMPALP